MLLAAPSGRASTSGRRLLSQAREPLADSERCLVHGDLGAAHLLCDHQGLLAIIDWTDIALGDPALDLAWVLNGLDRRPSGKAVSKPAPQLWMAGTLRWLVAVGGRRYASRRGVLVRGPRMACRAAGQREQRQRWGR